MVPRNTSESRFKSINWMREAYPLVTYPWNGSSMRCSSGITLKAFNVMPDEHLILLPFQGYVTNGYASRIQLIDLNRDSLVLRGTIDHPCQPRRATVHQDRILSLSGQELLSVDATDRDQPQIKNILPLAWSVDRLFAQDKH